MHSEILYYLSLHSASTLAVLPTLIVGCLQQLGSSGRQDVPMQHLPFQLREVGTVCAWGINVDFAQGISKY